VGDETAIELLVGAARDAAPRAPATAGRWLLAAVDLLPLDSEAEIRAGLLAEAAGALTSAGAYEDSLLSLQEAISLAPPEKIEARAELIATLAYARRRSGRPFDSRAALEQALGSLREGDSTAAASVQLELALDRLWHEEFDAMLGLTECLVSMGRERGDLSLVSLAGSLSSLANSSEGRIADAAAELADAQAAYEAMADDELAKRIYASFYVSLAAVRLERADDALAHLNRGLDVARMTGQAATVIPWPAIAALSLVSKGRIGEAVAVARTAIDAGGLSRNDWRTVWAMEADALAAYWAGDTDRAIASSGEMVRRSQSSHRFLSGTARIQLGGALYAAGDHEAAAAELAPLDVEGLWRLLDRNAAHGWDLLVRVRIALRDLDSAEAAVERALERAEAAGLSCQLATAGCCEASVMLARGDTGGASRQAREACETARAGGNPALRARARAVLGAALAADGRRDQASKELAGAERALAECGAVREADAAARELRRLGGRVRRARPQRASGLATLTPRENEIASHVAMGESNREIASALFLSEKTVESHLVRAYAKLGVHSRSALTALIVRGERSSEPGGSSESTVRTR
jgi:ATP/maltotriose-dependent transcriptional regulator MalT